MRSFGDAAPSHFPDGRHSRQIDRVEIIRDSNAIRSSLSGTSNTANEKFACM